MWEREFPCVEHLPFDAVLALGERVFSNFAVRAVAEDGGAERREMDANLMGAPGFDAAREKGVFAGDFRFQRFVVGDGRLSRFVDADLGFVLGVLDAEEFFSNGAAGILRSARGDRGVRLVHLVVLEGREEPVQRAFRFGDEDDAGGVAVDAVHERRTERERVQFSGIVIGNGFDEGIFVAFVVARVDVQSRGFVYGKNEIVFEEDAVSREREFRSGRVVFLPRRTLPNLPANRSAIVRKRRVADALSSEFGKLLFRKKEFHRLARFEPVVVLALFSVDFRAVGTSEFVDQRKRRSGKELF